MSGAPVQSPLSSLVWPRLKRAVRAAIDACGHLSGAQATCGRKQVVGDWNNRSLQAFPPVDCAMAMDEVALSQGRRPEILHAYAAELGFAAYQMPEIVAEFEGEALALIEAFEEAGEAASAIREMIADGVRQQHERDRCMAEIDQTIAKWARLRAMVAGPVSSARSEAA